MIWDALDLYYGHKAQETLLKNVIDTIHADVTKPGMTLTWPVTSYGDSMFCSTCCSIGIRHFPVGVGVKIHRHGPDWRGWRVSLINIRDTIQLCLVYEVPLSFDGDHRQWRVGINTIYYHQTSVNMLDSGFTGWLRSDSKRPQAGPFTGPGLKHLRTREEHIVNMISRHSCSKYCVRHQIFKKRRLLVDVLQHLCDQRKRQQRRPTGHGES